MKDNEILAAIPAFAQMKPEDVLSSPAWTVPCRIGDAQTAIKPDPRVQAGALELAIDFDGEPNVLSICDTERFPALHEIWDSLGEVPEPIVLALVEKDCGGLLQAVENAVRMQLRITGLAKDPRPEGRRLAMVADGIRFSLLRSGAVDAALGNPRFLDPAHDAVRSTALAAEAEYASFVLDADEVSSIAAGDFLLLPEIGTIEPSLVVDGRFAADGAGVAAWKDDGRLRVVGEERIETTLGALFDAAAGIAPVAVPAPSRLRLVRSGATLASGRLGKLAGQDALAVESAGAASATREG